MAMLAGTRKARTATAETRRRVADTLIQNLLLGKATTIIRIMIAHHFPVYK
jgi:hypothetical protein